MNEHKAIFLAFLLLTITVDPAPSQRPQGQSLTGRVSSVYTDLSPARCKTLELDEETADSVQRCPGVGGYRLLVIDSDARISITVVTHVTVAG